MKILWVVAFVLPEASHLTGSKKMAFGGWVGAMLKRLGDVDDIELGIVMKADINQRKSATINDTQYYLIPQKKSNHFDVEALDCEFVLADFQPDILHIEGSESAHALTFLNCWGGNNVVSMQGIINGYEPYEYGGLPIGRMLFSLHPVKTRVAASLILNKKIFFKPRLKIEKQTITRAKNILGRTTWDRAHAYAINPEAPYYSCSRILRESFYQQQWDIRAKKKHSLFIGNAASPRKGAHFVLEAIAIVKNEFPEIKLCIAGESPFYKSWKEWKKAIGYKAYLRYLIKKLDIEKHIEFTGVLQENEMAEKLKNSHIYIMSSVIENSPNTLGEAMIMGVPCITAYTGGTPDMATDNKDALFYRANDPQFLAYQIKTIFDNDELAQELSLNAKRKAARTHDPERNLQALRVAYQAMNSAD